MKRIDKYHIFAEIHKGPITTLYKAFHPQLDRVVLIKQLNPEYIGDNEICSRFQQEGLITAKINHPNVIGIYDYSDKKYSPFIVMEFIEGISLAEVITKYASLPVDIVITILNSMCRGIQALHKKNYLHRDIKPANTLISGEGQVKIGDFGFAESRSLAGDQILGTAEYIAPEYILSKEVDEHSDIFSMGVIFYELLSGENPFRATTTEACFKKIVNFDPVSIKIICPKLPDELAKLCMRMLEKSAERRPSSVDQIIQTFGSFTKKIDKDAITDFFQNPNQYEETLMTSESGQPEPEAPVKTAKPHRGKIIWLSISMIGFLTIILIMFKIIDPKKQNNHGENLATPHIPDKDSVTYAKEITTSPVTKIDSAMHGEIEKPSTELNELNRISSQRELSKNSSDSKTEDSTTRTIQITINTDPRAWLIINDDTVGITPVSYPVESVPTTLNTKINNPGFPEIDKKIEIAEQTDQEFAFSLWEEVGYLKVTINPWGQIWIDGDSVDVTPRPHPIILSRGLHVLEIRHPASKSILENIYIAPGDTLTKTYQLKHVR